MTSPPPTLAALVLGALRAALAVVLPTECVACGVPDWPLCPECADVISPPARGAGVGAGAGAGEGAGARSGTVALVIETGRDPPLRVWAAVPYDPALRSALSAFKESGRTDVAAPLARVLGAAVAQAHEDCLPGLPRGAFLELTVAPSSAAAFRRRGYDPVSLLARRARGSSLVSETLRFVRAAADQAGLGVNARRKNLSGSLAVRRRFRGRLTGRHFLVIDDVVTTGSTLIECRRALESEGATVWGAATLSFAQKHVGVSAVRPSGEPPVHIRGTDDTTTAADYGG